MKRSTLLTSATAGAAALLVALSGPALAAGPYTVTAGSTASGTTTFTGTAGSILFDGPNADVTCSSGTAGGTVNLGSNADGVGIASISSTTFSGCSGPLGLSLAVKQSAPWRLNATGTPTNGVTTGTIDQVTATVSSTGLIPCSFTVSGAVDGAFDQNSQTLKITPGSNALTISNVSGCVGFVANGQTATMTTTYTIAAQAGAIAIS